MTREKQIIEAGINYTLQMQPMAIGGDNFADSLEEYNRNSSFEAGEKWAERTMIERACEWLKENAADYAFYQDGEECYNFEELIIDFKRAMR